MHEVTKGLPLYRPPGVASDSDAHSGADDADRFLIHARSLRAVIEHMQGLGEGEPAIREALTRYGLADANPNAYDGFMSLNRFARLLQGLARQYGDEALGLTLGGLTHHAGLGVLGQAVGSAPTLNAGLDLLATHARLYADVSFTSLSVSGNRAEFSWAYSPLLVSIDQLADRAARLFVATIQRLHVADWLPTEVHLQRRQPANTAPYRRLLAPVMHFDAVSNIICFRADDLERPNRHADAFAHEAALQLLDRMARERRVPDDLSIRVREDVMANLAEGASGVAETARRLGMSTRALQRRLDELGTSYQVMCDEVRRSLALELLQHSNLPMGEIAWRLGFSNQANLTRAAKRWFDATPKQVRAGSPG